MKHYLSHLLLRWACYRQGHDWVETAETIEPLRFADLSRQVELGLLVLGAVLALGDPFWALPLLGGTKKERYCPRCGRLEHCTMVGKEGVERWAGKLAGEEKWVRK